MVRAARSGHCDVLVVGGGPAGLSAALVLGRSMRRVLVCDSGEYRNEGSRALHGFLTRDNIAPRRLRAIAEAELARYDVPIVRARVERIGGPVSDGPTSFEAVLAGGERLTCRKVVLATGLVDVLPPIDNVRSLLGRGVYLCPYCDGWEVRGRPIGVHGTDGAGLAESLLTWSRDVVWFSDGAVLPEADLARLTQLGIAVVPEPVRRLVGRGTGLQVVHLAGGRQVRRQALFLKLAEGQRQRSDLAEQLGLRVTSARGVEVGERGATSRRGVYVAGDASRDLLFAVTAAAEGAAVAVAVNTELRAEDLG